jgi:IMP and pyridine-specific 5'-nucleotidase
VGRFFTPLLLEDAFVYQDRQRYISSRRFVPPSFNDIRLILNTAQIMSLVKGGGVKLVTFDGDVTLYDDGASLTADNPVIPRILHLLEKGAKVGIVTAAGYTDASKYYERLFGLLDAILASTELTTEQQRGLIVLGGESNYLFAFDPTAPDLLTFVHRNEWLLEEMKLWSEDDIEELLDVAEEAFRGCVLNLNLPAEVLRKGRAVGVYSIGGAKMAREQLEETVLVVQQTVEISAVGKRLPFCAFNGTC